MTETAIAYVRSATTEASLDDQLADIQAHCEREGYGLSQDRVYQDVGAGTTLTRQGYVDFLEAVNQGDADVVLAVDGTRFGRSWTAIVALAKACHQSDTRIEYTEDGPSLDDREYRRRIEALKVSDTVTEAAERVGVKPDTMAKFSQRHYAKHEDEFTPCMDPPPEERYRALEEHDTIRSAAWALNMPYQTLHGWARRNWPACEDGSGD